MLPRQISIYRSRPTELKVGNFGDELTIPLLRQLFSIEAVPAPMHRAEMIAIGSILDEYSRGRLRRRVFTQLFTTRRPLHVWGSGFMLSDSSANWPRPVHIHGVRGKLTASRLNAFEGSIGDPGILASLLVKRPMERSAPVVIVPHFVDERAISDIALPRLWRVVHPDGDVLDVIKGIAGAELVISSSLHGLIVADAFGIPAIWARSVNDLFRRSDYKFFDHASARGRDFNEPASYAELTELKLQGLQDMATTPNRDISEWQKGIADSFPLYLFN